MKKQYLFLCMLLCVGLTGCTKDELPIGNDATVPPGATYAVSLESALADLQQHLGSVPATRNATYDANEVLTLRAGDFAATRSASEGDDEALAYIVNFDSDGYAILGADSRQSSLIALVGEGSITPAQLVEAKRAVDAREQVETPEFINALVANYILEAPQDPDNQSRIVSPPYNPGGNTWKTTEEQLPMLKTKWGQNGIYKRYCYDSAGVQRAAGCVAIATAQILLYNHNIYGKGPQYINNMQLNWSKLDAAAQYADLNDAPAAVQEEATRFIFEVGKAVKVTYDDESNSGTYNVVQFMRSDCMLPCYQGVEKKLLPGTHPLNNQYWVVPPPELSMSMFNFAETYVKPMLYWGKKPIYIDGSIYYTEPVSKDDDDKIRGHAWVLDGWQKQTKQSTIPGTPYTQFFVYCNYGYYGDEDGKYSLGVFYGDYNYKVNLILYGLK